MDLLFWWLASRLVLVTVLSLVFPSVCVCVESYAKDAGVRDRSDLKLDRPMEWNVHREKKRCLHPWRPDFPVSCREGAGLNSSDSLRSFLFPISHRDGVYILPTLFSIKNLLILPDLTHFSQALWPSG
jgi:hypothetical protein